MFRPNGLLALTLLAALVLPAPAVAGQTLTGKSSQQRRVVVRVGDYGRVSFFRIDWVAPCRGRTSFAFEGRTLLVTPLVTSTPTEFTDAGSYSDRFADGTTGRLTITAAGTRAADGSWSGSFQITRLIPRWRGRRIGTCRSKPIRWSAR